MIGSRLLAAVAFAASLIVADPAAATQKAFQFALQNGMQVVVIPDHRAPVVTQMLFYRVGAADDPPGLSGLAHFLEHLMFRGTKSFPGDQFTSTIARNGGEANAFTMHDFTCYYEQIARDKLKLAMSLEADRMTGLDLSDSAVATEREVVLEERRSSLGNDPKATLDEQLEAALYLSHPYGRPVVGWPDEVRKIGSAEAQTFYEQYYAPNNAILVVVGDVSVEEARAEVVSAYGRTMARPRIPRPEYADPPRIAESRMMVLSKDAKVPYFSRIYRVGGYAEAGPGEAESHEVLAQLLGGDVTGALYRKLVVERKIASDASASYEGMVRDSGEFRVDAVPRPGVSLENLERAVDQVITHYATSPAPRAELDRAKKQLVASTVFRRDSQSELASAYGEALAIGLSLDDVDAWPDRIRKVSDVEIEKAATSDLVKQDAVTGYLVPQIAR